jgi:tRNA 2-thiouridine synthesizing protein A
MSDELDLQDDALVTEALLSDLRQIRDRQCAVCERAICGHEALMSLAMGFKNAPRCVQCLSVSLGHSREVLRDRLSSFITSRNCYNEGWLWANREENIPSGALPGCLWPPTESSSDAEVQRILPAPANDVGLPDSKHSTEWNAGDMGCGDLVLELRTRMKPMLSGQVLRLMATNPGAKEDLPSWCRLTGNILIGAQHPVYFIRKK